MGFTGSLLESLILNFRQVRQGLKLALANSQNASENQKLQEKSASIFLRVQNDHRKLSILANLKHN